MEIRSESRIGWPRERVYRAYRDELPRIAAYLPDIREVIVKSRSEREGGLSLHNEWRAQREIPSFARRFLSPEQLAWDDYAEWSDPMWHVDWRIVPRAFTGAVRCEGRNAFFEDGGGTRVLLTGMLSIDLSAVRGFPSFLAPSIGPQVEKFIVSLITPNLEQVNASIQKFLDAERP